MPELTQNQQILDYLKSGKSITPLTALKKFGCFRLSARKLDLNFFTNTQCYFLPCIAGHVGADTSGMILSEEIFHRKDMSLLVDVGTNAEIVLGNNKKILAASSPTGPAFEGAQISC